MGIKGKFAAIGVAVLILVAILIGMTVVGAQVYANLVRSSEIASAGLRNHMTGDMMHDSLRSDVYRALFVAEVDPALAKQSLADVAEHAELFRSRLAANKALDLPDSVRPTLDKLDVPLEAYISQAEVIVATAFTDRAAAIASLPQFDERFEGLEGVMESASEVIEGTVADLAAQGARFETLSIIATIVAALLGLGVAAAIYIFASRTIAEPITGITAVLKRLSEGDTSVELEMAERQDEIGDLAKTVAVFRQNTIEKQRYEARSQEDEQVREERRQRIDQLIEAFRGASVDIMGQMASEAEALKRTAEELSTASGSTADDAISASSASEQASNNVETVAAATEEMVASVGEISQQMTKTTDIVSDATNVAANASERITSLSTAAEKIGDVVSLIHDIAEQTNLLALNATIEAARAGDAGRGFAVVASEVKALAEQTAKATEEISNQIHQIQSSTGGAVDSIQEITGKIKSVHEYAVAVLAAVEEQSTATSEIGRTIQDAASETRHVTSNMSTLMTSVDHTRKSVAHVMEVSGSVGTQSENLRKTIDAFLTDVAAA